MEELGVDEGEGGAGDGEVEFGEAEFGERREGRRRRRREGRKSYKVRQAAQARLFQHSYRANQLERVRSEMQLEVRSTDEGEEFHLRGRGVDLWSYSIWAIRAEIERRLSEGERRAGEERGMKGEEMVTRLSWDSMRGYGLDGWGSAEEEGGELEGGGGQ